MTMHVKERRKAVQVGWQTAAEHPNDNADHIIHGTHASILGEEPFDSGHWEEKLNVPNDGDAVVHYGEHFTGQSRLRVVGSTGGQDEITFEVL